MLTEDFIKLMTDSVEALYPEYMTTLNEYFELHYHVNREMGYLGELLFGVWLTHNNINFRYYSCINTTVFDLAHPDKNENVLMTPGELIRLKKVLKG